MIREQLMHGNYEPDHDEPADMKVIMSRTLSEIKKLFRAFLHLDPLFPSKEELFTFSWL